MSEAVVVGSGPNGLAAAVTLAASGVQVTVLEAAPRIGGGTRCGELTGPGLIHDECSAAHPLAVDNPFVREFDLAAEGLRWCWPEVEYSHPLDGGDGAAAVRSLEETADGLGSDGRRWKSVFGPTVAKFDEIAEDFMRPVLHVPAHPVALARFGVKAGMPASVLMHRWRGEPARALFGGVAAHAFRPLGAQASSAVAMVLGAVAHRHGWPVAQGGSQAITTAMAARLRRLGGRVETGMHVTSLAELGTPDIVMLDTSPAGAAAICGERLSGRVRRAYRRFRHGPGAFKLDLAVHGGVPWQHEASRRAGTVHLGGSFAEIAAAERAVSRGEMPERPFVIVCQQYLADPSRSRGELHPVYSYAHVPRGYAGDATAAIEAQIERFAPGFRERVVARHVRGPAALEAYNENYLGGDIITGANDPRQLLFRPRVAINPYATGIPGVFLCSAATPPGAGAHGVCGYNAAQAALARLG